MIIALAVTALMIVLIMVDKLPFGAPPLLALLILVVLGVSDIKTTFGGFSNSTIVMLASFMAIATCVSLGLDPTAAAAAIVVSGWCGHFLPIDGMPAMIMGAGDYKIGEFWKFTIPQYTSFVCWH